MINAPGRDTVLVSSLLHLLWRRTKNKLAPWSNLARFKRHVPRYAFIHWMLCERKLCTKDKLKQWGICQDDSYVMCQEVTESEDHLFFECPVVAKIWCRILELNFIHKREVTWQEENPWFSCYQFHSRFASDLYKLALSVYHIWRNRNESIH
ncbi:hypothetical protein ACH5RR_008462 [Cinchona calisaya]|uniref:Reverse transcriptase zinc-binding domain-containing protein n=1 Tax=Cinchona calisaya TaxID=153742 RepID=A0ABD3AFA3_9GENT